MFRDLDLPIVRTRCETNIGNVSQTAYCVLMSRKCVDDFVFLPQLNRLIGRPYSPTVSVWISKQKKRLLTSQELVFVHTKYGPHRLLMAFQFVCQKEVFPDFGRSVESEKEFVWSA